MQEKLRIISLSVQHISFRESIEQVMEWGQQHTPSYVCFANVHMTIEAYKDPIFLEKLNQASLVLADGKPIAIACNLLYKRKQERISGMDFTPRLLEAANERKATVFLYGSTTKVLNALQKKIFLQYPQVKIGGTISPPFGNQMQPNLLEEHINQINGSGANIVFVALGCPKQEKWMADNHAKINAVLLGVGGAFPVMAGIQQRSPKWMQDWSLEWLYRLKQEPRRMFKRYFYTNTYFIWLLLIAWFKKR
jgi:N-acetylglucosaminyldiphosphoundecaprenol N-acetyl-beta-D-mannosaminyltransferase